MAESISDLKKNRKRRFDDLRSKVEDMDKNTSSNKDERFWQPTVDKAGNGAATIRFLDAPVGETSPYVRMFDHGFRGPTNEWFIENSLTTLGQKDPVSEYNSRLWNSGVESDKDIARAQKRRLHFIANILVIDDPANPENNGKVFLYRFGKKIFEKIESKLEPDEDEVDDNGNPVAPVNVFDFWEGCNFRLKIKNVEGYRNYDNSKFLKSTALFDDDADIERVWRQEHSLEEFLDLKNFKSYDELLARLNKVLGFDTQSKELMRPGDVMETTPSSHETAESRIQEELYNKSSESEEVKTSSKTEESEDDMFDSILSTI
jgi:hypothetical protein